MLQQKQGTVMDFSDLSDSDLIRQAKQGQLEAFNQLYDRHLTAVYNRVRYRIPDTDVEDVVQEVFIAAMKSLKSFKGNAKFSTWLRTLTNRRIADYYRARNDAETQLDTPLSETPPGQISGLRVSDSASLTDDKIILREAMMQIPDHYQEVLLLRFAEGLKFKEIARVQGQSLEATKSMFRRAIQALRDQLGVSNV